MLDERRADFQRLNARVEGMVQGVGFRAFVEQAAIARGLTGWVRNRWDGTVELAAEGPRPDLEDLLRVIRRGPRASTVRSVQIEWQTASNEFPGFMIRRTD
jgi:acylphosphatase